MSKAKRIQLTKPQLRFLRAIAESPNGQSCLNDHKPMLALVRYGFANHRDEAYGHGTTFETCAGRAFLASLDENQSVRKE